MKRILAVVMLLLAFLTACGRDNPTASKPPYSRQSAQDKRGTARQSESNSEDNDGPSAIEQLPVVPMGQLPELPVIEDAAIELPDRGNMAINVSPNADDAVNQPEQLEPARSSGVQEDSTELSTDDPTSMNPLRFRSSLAAAPFNESAAQLRNPLRTNSQRAEPPEDSLEQEQPAANALVGKSEKDEVLEFEDNSASQPAAVPPAGGRNADDLSLPEIAPDSTKSDEKVVRVFYATDRKAQRNSLGKPSIPMSLGSLLLLASIVGGFVSFRTSRRFTVAFVCMGLVAIIAIGVSFAQPDSSDRAESDSPRRRYGSEHGAMVYGHCDVSIPPRHQYGEIERPSVLRLEFRENEDKHVVIKSVQELRSSQFFASMRQRVQKSRQKDLFVFVHGYNVTFDIAARRTAQMANDLGFQGAPVFFSWPSQGEFSDYSVDEASVSRSAPHLRQFLLQIAEQSSAQRIHLIGHSMGNRALADAIRELANHSSRRAIRFNEVVLAAPDIDAEEFRSRIAPAIASAAERVTLYASSNDRALMASRLIHGYSRAGESGDNLLVVPGIETIDVSQVDHSILGHSYYGSSGPVLRDLQAIFRGESPLRSRSWLQADERDHAKYWRLVADQGLARRDEVHQ